MAEKYRCRASSLLDIKDPFEAYCIDMAVFEFGSAVQNALDSVKGKTDREVQQKRDRTMRKWLGLPAQYREPVATTAPTK